MKKWVFVILVISLFSFSVSAQTVPVSEFKITLIDAIKDYLTSQTPKLEKDELKDLIVAYITAPTDTIDMSGNGKFSGKKLSDIYNKAKGVTTGEYSEQVKNAVKLNQLSPNANVYGYYSRPPGGQGQFQLPMSKTTWFLIDPKSVGISSPYITFQITDYTQDNNLEVILYTIDASDNLIGKPYYLALDGNTGGWASFGQHNDSKRYLVSVRENGTKPVPVCLYWL